MTSRPILGAVDIYESSPSAARCATWLARTSGAPLELVYVFDAGRMPALPRVDPVIRRRLREQHRERVRARAIKRLAAIAAGSPGIRTSATVVEGLRVPALQELAIERQPALLVTGTAAREGLEHVLEGSVAGQLARSAPCPVTVVPPGAAVGDAGPVLVGDDGSDHAAHAVRHAAGIARRLGRDVVRMQVEQGDPVTVLGDAAREQRACLIVSGSRGRGPVRAELFGSVSAGLVQRAGRPVVVVSASAGEPQ